MLSYSTKNSYFDMTCSVYGTDMEAAAPISPITMEIPVKMERLEDRHENGHLNAYKQEKNYFQVTEIDDEVETSLSVSHVGGQMTQGHYSASTASGRRDTESEFSF